MGAVLWGIGKTIGIVILILLLLVLMVLLLILLVPIRYRAEGTVNGGVRGSMRVTWLFHLISFRLLWDGEMRMSLRILGFWLMGKEKQKKSRRKRRGNRHRQPTRNREPAKQEPGRPTPDESRELPERLTPDEVGKSPEKPAEHELPVRPENRSDQAPDLVRPDGPAADRERAEKPTVGSEPSVLERGFRSILSVLWKLGKRIAKIVDTVCSVPVRVRRLFKTARTTLHDVFVKLKEAEHKKDQILEFLEDEENRRMLLLLKRQIFVLIRHILPRKIEGRIRFGFDDPGKTGQVLMAASPFYGFYGRTLELIPVFDGQALEGNVSLKGRIRIGTLIVIAIRVWMNRNFRILVTRLRRR